MRGRVPIPWKQPERRRHVRIVTLRNFGWLTIAMIVLFAAITIRSEMRGRHTRDHGRLFHRQIVRETPPPKPPVEIVHEAPAPTSHAATFVEPMTVEPLDQSTITAPVVAPRARDSRVAIVGGAEGLTVVQRTQKRPRLRGGFGR